MAKDVETYLRELQAALMAGGADPALVQDALFDAEEYLRAEMAVGGVVGRGTAIYESRLAAVTEKYGTPGEVATAYLEEPASDVRPAGAASGAVTAAAPTAASAAAFTVPATAAPTATPAAATATATAAPETVPGATTSVAGEAPIVSEPTRDEGAIADAWTRPEATTPRPMAAPPQAQASYQSPGHPGATQTGAWRQIFGVVTDPAVYKALLYMILSLGLGIVYFTIVVTGVSTAGGMLVLIIGVPLFVLVLGLVRAMAFFEGRLIEGLLGTRMPRRPRAEPVDANLFERMWFWFKDGRTWASMAYLILMLPLGTVYFTVAVTGLAAGLGLIVSPLANWIGDTHTFVWNGITHQWWMPFWAMPLAVIAGVVLLIAWLHLVRWIGRGHAAFAKAMLVRLAR